MRSFWYRLTHKPMNLDDCLVLADTRPVKGASLQLQYHKLIREQWLLIHLLAVFEVNYTGQTCTVEELCGGYFETDSKESKRVAFDRANAKLKKLKEKLANRGVVLSNSDKEFEYNPSAERERRTRKNPYEQFAETELILRDHLAIDRTVLANERTFLAYCRTSLALILTGAGSIKFFDSLSYDVAGWVLIVLGLIVVVAGTWRFAVMARIIDTARRQSRTVPPGRNVPSPGAQADSKNLIDTDAE